MTALRGRGQPRRRARGGDNDDDAHDARQRRQQRRRRDTAAERENVAVTADTAAGAVHGNVDNDDDDSDRDRDDGDTTPSSEDVDGEDLYGDNFVRDYLEPDEESEEAADDVAGDEDNDWIVDDDDSAVSEISVAGRMAVDALLERRAAMERRLREEQQRLQDGVFSDVSDDDDDADDDDEEDEEDDENDEAARVRRVGGTAAADAASGGGNGDGADDGDVARDEDVNGNAAVYVRGELEASDFNWRHVQGTLHEWLAQELPRRVVKNRIYNFYLNYVEGGVGVYEARVTAMTRDNDMSLPLSYSHLSRVYDSVLALWLVDAPDAMLALLEEVANFFVFRLYPHYRNVHAHIFVRVYDLPLCDPIRDFRQLHMNVLVRVEGVVVRRSPVYPQLYAVKYDCVRCGYIIGPLYQRGDREQRVSVCPSCHSKGPFHVNMLLTEYRNHQTVVLQEPPSKVPPGRLPRSLEVVLTNDLIDCAKPGEEVDVTGIYRNNFDPLLNSRQGFAVFTTVLHANSVLRRASEPGGGGSSSSNNSGGGTMLARMPEDERRRLVELSKHPQIRRKLLRSVAPSIHGRDDIKLGLLLAMLGGVPKDVGGDQSHRIRGDINVLLVGDPGCAKSQFLKFVEKTAERSVFTTGRGSTAVGLTAAVHKDSVTGDFVLEGGALVLADRGCCLIDEFDKMSDQDRTSIHEAMEQQTISVARGGIVTTLTARCCVIAAANPIGGRYDTASSFDANVNLTTPILSRFDLLFVVRDEVNAELDARLAAFICASHTRNHPRSRLEARQRERARHEELTRLRYALENATSDAERNACEQRLQQLLPVRGGGGGGHVDDADDAGSYEDDDPASDKPLPLALLKRYIVYARAYCNPRIANIDGNTIARLYTQLRQESRHQGAGGMAITVRHMESILRLSEAHARLHLREFVRDDDVTAAMALFLRCFIQTQKYSMRSALERRFHRYLESDTEPLPLIQHRIRVAVQSVRQFERHMSGGVEPARVRVDLAELEQYTASVSTEALYAYFDSDAFRREFVLIRDPVTNLPVQIEHCLA